jgi:hypothetical protein
MVTSVVDAVERDLRDVVARADEATAEGPLAASALVLARELDSPDTPAASKASCSRELRAVLGELHDAADAAAATAIGRDAPPATPEVDAPADRLGDLAERRARRRAEGAA